MKKPKMITPEELKNKMDMKDNYILVDVLSASDFNKSHIKGAMNIPLSEVEAKGADWLNRNVDIVVYSAGPSCNGAQFAQAHLQKKGFRVWQLEGGFETWIQHSYPIDGDPNFKHGAIKNDTVVEIESRKEHQAHEQAAAEAKATAEEKNQNPGNQKQPQKKKAA